MKIKPTISLRYTINFCISVTAIYCQVINDNVGTFGIS